MQVIFKSPEPDSTASAKKPEAFKVAKKNFIKNSINRIILCSDGISNAGEKEQRTLLDLVNQESSSELSLSTVGIGFENYNDDFLEKLATNGMGFYVYVNNEKDVTKAFLENASDVLQAIAKDKLKLEISNLEESFNVFSAKRKERIATPEEREFLSYCAWLSLYRKGLMMLEAYQQNIIPKIKKVLAIQKSISLKDTEGNTTIGFGRKNPFRLWCKFAIF